MYIWVYLPNQVSSNRTSTHNIDIFVVRLDSHNEPSLQTACKVSPDGICYFSVYSYNKCCHSCHTE